MYHANIHAIMATAERLNRGFKARTLHVMSSTHALVYGADGRTVTVRAQDMR